MRLAALLLAVLVVIGCEKNIKEVRAPQTPSPAGEPANG